MASPISTHASIEPLLPLSWSAPVGSACTSSASSGEVVAADHDLPGLRLRLQAGRDVRRVADRGEAALLGASDVADDCRPRVDPDAEARPVRLGLELAGRCAGAPSPARAARSA